VLVVDELLELILSFLDPRTLLLAQRVNQRYKDLITTSPSLQMALFFRPRDQEKQPVLIDQRQRPYKYVRHNELLSWAFPTFFKIPDNDSYERNNFRSFRQFPWVKSQESTAAFRRKEASWRNMLLCDPPIARSSLKMLYSGMVAERCKEASLCCDDGGLRMGELYDHLQYHVVEWGARGNPDVSFEVQWPVLRRKQNQKDSGRGHRMYVCDGKELEVDVVILHVFYCLIMPSQPEERNTSPSSEQIFENT